MRGGGSSARLDGCRLRANEATAAGGAVHVAGAGARVVLANGTLLLDNAAPVGTAMLLAGRNVAYALPTPLGRWIATADGTPVHTCMCIYMYTYTH